MRHYNKALTSGTDATSFVWVSISSVC